MLKILHIIPNLVKGGAQRIAIDICIELSKRPNCDVILLYFDGPNEFEFLTNEIRVQKIKISFNLSISSKHKINITEFEQLLDQFNPNIIHSHLYLAELVSRENIRKGIRYITHCHDNIRQFQKFNSSVLYKKLNLIEYMERRRLFKKYKHCNNTFLAISENGLLFLKKNLPDSSNQKIILLHNAINIQHFLIKKDFEKPLMKLNLINVGNLIPKKNQVFLVSMVNELLNVNQDCHLTLVGDGITRKEIETKITDLELTSKITMTGRIDDVRKMLTQNTLYVHSALYEPFGLVLVEAMAAGLPVISLNGKGNQDIIIDDYNGYIVSENDPKLFAEKVIEVYSNQELYKTLAKNAQKVAIEKYDIKNYTNKLIEIYSSTLNK